MVFTFSTILKASVCLFTMMISFHLLPGHAQIDIDAALSTDVSESTQSVSESSIQRYDEHGDIGAPGTMVSTQDHVIDNQANTAPGVDYRYEPPTFDDVEPGSFPAVETDAALSFEAVLTPAIQAAKTRKPLNAKIRQRKQALKGLADAIDRLALRKELFILKQTQAQLNIEKLNAITEKLALKRAEIERQLADSTLTLETRETLESRLIALTERDAQLDEKLNKLDGRLERLALKIENTHTKLNALGYVEADATAPSSTHATQG